MGPNNTTAAVYDTSVRAVYVYIYSIIYMYREIKALLGVLRHTTTTQY